MAPSPSCGSTTEPSSGKVSDLQRVFMQRGEGGGQILLESLAATIQFEALVGPQS
jgi:hypothetical protein